MAKKKVLLIDDDQFFLEPLVDGLSHDGIDVLTAKTAQEALEVLAREKIDLVTIDIMLDPGEELYGIIDTHSAGLFLCREIKKRYPDIDAFCISVVSDTNMIDSIKRLGIRFFPKGETPLRTVLNMVRSKLTGLAYSSEHDNKRRFE